MGKLIEAAGSTTTTPTSISYVVGVDLFNRYNEPISTVNDMEGQKTVKDMLLNLYCGNCNTQPFVSRICELGTRCCITEHSRE